ncbi:hypothetical protein K439DRAFT_1630588 [Ramaria rubella]|nr:hypothetical protein K439DRAFT_1630588 [Ramaria rubella]
MDNERKVDIIKAAHTLWNQTRQLEHDQVDPGPSDHLSNANLIRVYIYAARAIVNANGVNSTETSVNNKDQPSSGIVGTRRRSFTLEDTNTRGCIFRALRLCEAILPDRMAHLAGNYLHSIYQAPEIHTPKLDSRPNEDNDVKHFSCQSVKEWTQSRSTKSSNPLGLDLAKICSVTEVATTFDPASLSLDLTETTVLPPQMVQPVWSVLAPDTARVSLEQRISNSTNNTVETAYAQRVDPPVYEATSTASSSSGTEASGIDLESGRCPVRTRAALFIR